MARHHGGDRDLGAAGAARMNAGCDRLPVLVAQSASAKCGFVEARGESGLDRQLAQIVQCVPYRRTAVRLAEAPAMLAQEQDNCHD